MNCIYTDGYDFEEEEEGYDWTIVQCMCNKCSKTAPFTARSYSSDYGIDSTFQYYNLGKNCPVTRCCNGPVCFTCAFQSTIFCEYCRKPTTVDFLDKEALHGYFSVKTECWNITDWFAKLWTFHEFRQELKGDCQLFFLWLKEHYKGRWWYPDHDSWHHLDQKSERIQTLIRKFRKFLLAIASKMVVLQNFFSKIHQIQMIQPPFFAEINSRRQHLLPAFLETCYSLPFSSSFTRSQVAVVGTLAVRLSQYQKQFSKIIFSRIMLNLLLLNIDR